MHDLDSKLRAIRSSIRAHLNWLVSTVVGTDHLSDAERKEVRSLKLPKDFLDGTYFSFLLGKKKSESRPSSYKTMTWKEFLSYTRNKNLSNSDLNAIKYARERAATSIKTFSDELANGLYKDLQSTVGDVLTEAMLRDIVQDETAMAVLEQSSIESFKVALESRLATKGKKNWQTVARTELHRAKQQGIVHTIANKEDIYSSSKGIDSTVSVVPQSDACIDCRDIYLDAIGNPKVFILRDLVAAGLNTQHKKVHGKHVHWHATVPGLHANCFCELVYLPPGYSWVNGKLTITDKVELSKAFEGNFGAKTTPKPPSLPGAASPAQKGNVKGGPGYSQGQGPAGGSGVEYEYWPSGRGKPPKDGNWESYKKKDGLVGYRRPQGSGAGGGPKQEEQKDPAQITAEAKAFGKIQKDPNVIINHLQSGRIVQQENLAEAGDTTAGVTESFRVTIEGNGRGVMKPPAWHNNVYAQLGVLATEGSGSCPVGTGHLREKAAFHAFNAFGVQKVPPTVVRTHEGNPVSIQQWSETKEAISAKVAKGHYGATDELPKYGDGTPIITNETKYVLDSIKDKDKREKLIEAFKEANVMGILINHNDQHLGNVMIGDDMSLSFIDNTTAFGNGMYGVKVQAHMELHNMGIKTTIPDHLMERFKHTSFNDLKRSLGDHTEDWAVAQTFMRMKYMMYLQENEGHLDYEKFRPCIRAGASDSVLRDRLRAAESAGDPKAIEHYKMCLGGPRGGFWQGSDKEVLDDYDDRKANGLLSHQLFDSFAKQWIIESKNLPEGHPDRLAADNIDNIGIFMDPSDGFTLNIEDYRASGKHKKFAETIKPGYPPKDIKGASGITQASTTKKTAPSARKKPPSKNEDNKIKTPEALARTHLVLDLPDDENEKATNKKDAKEAVQNIIGSLDDSAVDDMFSNIIAKQPLQDEEEEDIIDLTDEVELLSMFDKSITKLHNPRLYIKL